MNMLGNNIKIKYILYSAIFTVAGIISLLTPFGADVKIFLTLIFILGQGYIVGKKLLPCEKLFWQIYIGGILHLSVLIIIGSLVYLFYKLNTGAILLVIVISSIIELISYLIPLNNDLVTEFTDLKNENKNKKSIFLKIIGICLAILLTILACYGLGILSEATTELSVRSPWDNVPRLFFIIAFMLTVGISASAVGKMATSLSLIPTILLSVVATAVASTVYAIGFGFDPFIHQATEIHIFEYGVMFPKTPYYLGQYSLVTILAKMVGGFVVTIDVWLVPLAFSLIIPIGYWSLKRAFDWDSSVTAFAILPILALPLSSFVMTTPQGLANIFVIMVAFLGLSAYLTSAIPVWAILIMAMAAVTIHPLAGIPLLLFVLLIWFLKASQPWRRFAKIRWTIFIKIWLLACVALPLMFIINSKLSDTGITLDNETIRTPIAILENLKNQEIINRRFSAVLDFVYSWRTGQATVLTIIGLTGLILLWLLGKIKSDQKIKEITLVFAFGSLAMFINYILLRTWIKFPFLIDYEQTNYADRLAILAIFIIAPLICYAVGRILILIQRRGSPLLLVVTTLLLASVITSNIYLAYPRRDHYESSRGWSTSAIDIEAVKSIEADAEKLNYIVLANQSVSAGAIRSLGFKKYYEPKNNNIIEPIFFYPIPTGGPLYKLFLEANENNGDKTTVLEAMNLTGVDTAYYVVNHYWWQAQTIIATAKKEADDWWVIDDKSWIFKYKK